MRRLDQLPRNRRLFIIIATLIVSIGTILTMAVVGAGGPSTLAGTTWQGIIDGTRGEGSFFYRLSFEDDGVVKVTKQQGEVNVYDEPHGWTLEDGILTIKSAPSDEIQDFEDAAVTQQGERSFDFERGGRIGTINYHDSPLSWVHFILILVILIGLNELFRNSKWAGVIFYFVLPFVLLPYWAGLGDAYWFKWVKVYSVVFACIWFTFMRFSKLDRWGFAKIVCGGFLALNIAEAVAQDFSMGNLPNILNGTAGVLSILTLWFGWKMVGKDRTEFRDMVWPAMPMAWIIPYDIWNWTFVYLNFPGSASGQLMVLLACTIPALFIKKGTWLQARAYTLAAWFMYYFTFPSFTESLQVMIPRTDGTAMVAAVLSIVTNLAYAGYFLWLIKKHRGLNPRSLGAIELDQEEKRTAIA